MIGLNVLQGLFQPKLFMSCGSLWNISPKFLSSFPVRNFLKLEGELEKKNQNKTEPLKCDVQW